MGTNLVPRVLSYWTEHLKFSVQFQDFFAFYFSTSKTGNSYASVIVVVRGRFKFILLHTIYRTWWIEGVMNVTKVIFWIFQVLQVVFGQLIVTMVSCLLPWSPFRIDHHPQSSSTDPSLSLFQRFTSPDQWSSNDFFNSRFSPNSSTLRMGQGDSRYNRWTAEIPTL